MSTLSDTSAQDPKSCILKWKKLARFSIAVNQPAIGKELQKPLWLDIEAWETVADRIVKCEIDRGKKSAISGSIAPNAWSKEVGDTFVEMHQGKSRLNSFELMSDKKEADLMVSPAAYDMEPELTVNESPSTKASPSGVSEEVRTITNETLQNGRW